MTLARTCNGGGFVWLYGSDGSIDYNGFNFFLGIRCQFGNFAFNGNLNFVLFSSSALSGSMSGSGGFDLVSASTLTINQTGDHDWLGVCQATATVSEAGSYNILNINQGAAVVSITGDHNGITASRSNGTITNTGSYNTLQLVNSAGTISNTGSYNNVGVINSTNVALGVVGNHDTVTVVHGNPMILAVSGDQVTGYTDWRGAVNLFATTGTTTITSTLGTIDVHGGGDKVVASSVSGGSTFRAGSAAQAVFTGNGGNNQAIGGTGTMTVNFFGNSNTVVAGSGNVNVQNLPGNNNLVDLRMASSGTVSTAGAGSGDVIYGSNGGDNINVGMGALVHCGDGNDIAFLRSGEVHGGAGNDILSGTTMYGDAGDDTLLFTAGNTLTGGDGNDRLVFSGILTSSDTVAITDFALGDTLDLRGMQAFGSPAVVTESGNLISATSGGHTLVIDDQSGYFANHGAASHIGTDILVH